MYFTSAIGISNLYTESNNDNVAIPDFPDIKEDKTSSGLIPIEEAIPNPVMKIRFANLYFLIFRNILSHCSD